MYRKQQFVKLHLTQFSYLTLLSPRKTIISVLQLMKLVKLSTKSLLNSGSPKNSKYLIQLNIKQILRNNIHSTNFQYPLFTGLHFTTSNSSSCSLKVFEMKFHYCSSTSPHKQTSSLRCSTFFLQLVNITYRLHWPHLLCRSTHSFNWSLQSQLLQLVSTESTASTGLH